MPRLILTVALVLGLPVLVMAQEKAVKKLSGTFTREVEGRTVSFTFKPDKFTFKMNDLVVTCAYGVADDVLFATVTNVEKSGDGPNKRDLVSFQFTLNKNELTLSEMKGTNVSDGGRRIIEGTYKKE